MHIFVARHAHAIDGADDSARPLSKKGLEQVRTVGRLLRRAEAVDVRTVWHSPLVRSRQSAREFVRRLHLGAELVEVSGLEPGDDPSRTARRLGDLRLPVLIVGHDPHLSALVTLLLTGREEPLCCHLKKGSVLRLDRSGGGWTLRWHITPEIA
jgi:phosphohistidine phosphatase